MANLLGLSHFTALEVLTPPLKILRSVQLRCLWPLIKGDLKTTLYLVNNNHLSSSLNPEEAVSSL